MTDVTDFRPQFGLRSMLIGFLVVGCAAGLLGKLYLSNPFAAISIVGVLTTVLPYLLAASTIIYLGRRNRHRGLFGWGVVLLLTPLVGLAITLTMQAFVRPGNGGMGVFSTKQLIQQDLAADPNDASVWNELEDRLEAGQLTKADVDAAVGELTKELSKKPEGWNQPLHWQRDFLSMARKQDLLSREVLIDVCDAYFGKRPRILPITANTGNANSIQIRYGSNWDSPSHHGLQVAHLWQVAELLVDGHPIELRQDSRHSERFDGYTKDPLPKDAQRLTARIEIAYVDSKKMIGLNNNQLPPERWPKAIKRWTENIEIPLDGTDPFARQKPQRKLKAISDPSKAPANPKVERLVVQQGEGGFRTLALELDQPSQPVIPISFDVFLEYEDSKIPMGSYYVVPYENGMSYSGNQLITRGHAIDEATEYATVVFEPNAEHLKKFLEKSTDRELDEIDEFWNKKIVLPDMELERLDLEVDNNFE